MSHMLLRNKFEFKLGHGIKGSIAIILAVLLTACVAGSGTTAKSSVNLKNGDQALVHTRLAQGYLKQKQYSVARDELEQALALNPNHSETNYVMALLKVELQQYADAQKHFARAVKSNRENSAAAHDFGTFLCQTEQERESVKYFEIAASNPLFERSELSYMRAGECLARINDPKAEQYLKRSLAINARLSPALLQLAMLKQENREHLSARAYVERYFAITKPQPAALLLAYQIESSLGAHDVAKKYRSQLLQNFPGSNQANQLRSRNRGR